MVNMPPINTVTTPSIQNVDPQLINNQLTSLLVSILQQQLTLNQQQQILQHNTDTPIATTTAYKQQITCAAPDIAPSDISLLQVPLSVDSAQPATIEGGGVSSDTVNELLKGLASSKSQEVSLQKLSEETADVLPTFAKAMIEMSGSSSEKNKLDTKEIDIITEDIPTQVSSSSSENSLLQFLQGENSAEVGNMTDSNFRHIMENTDFTDMFSQLRDILKTPEKTSNPQSNRHSPPKRDTTNVLGVVYLFLYCIYNLFCRYI